MPPGASRPAPADGRQADFELTGATPERWTQADQMRMIAACRASRGHAHP